MFRRSMKRKQGHYYPEEISKQWEDCYYACLNLKCKCHKKVFKISLSMSIPPKREAKKKSKSSQTGGRL